MKHFKYLVFVLATIISTNTRAQQWRVGMDIYQVWNGGGFATQDSTRYFYHADKGWGSSPMNDTIRYHKRKKYRIGNGTAELREDYLQKFYPDGEIHVIERQGLDTVKNQWAIWGIDSLFKTGKWLEEQKNYELMHKGNNVYALYATSRGVYTYNALAGVLTTRIYQTSYAFTYQWTNVNMNRYGYDTADRLIADSIYYTGVGNTWKLDGIDNYSNNSAGQRDWRVRTFYNTQTTGWDTSVGYKYYYNAQGQVDSMSFNLYLGGGQWAPQISYRYTYHPTGELATDSSFNVGGSAPFIKANRYTYDIPGHITEWQEESYNLYKQRHVYVYEIYWPVGVEGGEGQDNISLQVFPIPAAGLLNVTAKLEEGTPVKLTITDMQGRLLLQKTEIAKANFNIQLSISHLAAGNYVLSFYKGNATLPISKVFYCN